jgi:hypothetical protein
MKKIKKFLTSDGLGMSLEDMLKKVFKGSRRKKKIFEAILSAVMIGLAFAFFYELNHDKRVPYIVTELIIALLIVFIAVFSQRSYKHRVEFSLGMRMTIDGGRNVTSFYFFIKNGKISPTVYFSSSSKELTPFDVRGIATNTQSCDIELCDGSGKSLTLRSGDTKFIETLKSFFQEFIQLQETSKGNFCDGDDFAPPFHPQI